MMKRIDLFNSLLKDVWVDSADSDEKRQSFVDVLEEIQEFGGNVKD